MTANARRLLASGNELVTDELATEVQRGRMSFKGRLSKLSGSVKGLSFMARSQDDEKRVEMVEPMAMCALAQKLLRRQDALPVSLSVAPPPATELPSAQQENSLDRESAHSRLPFALPGVPSRSVGCRA